MNKALLILLFTFIFVNSHAQVPPYRATVYDTTVTGYYFLNPALNASNSMQVVLDAKGKVVYYKNFPGALTFDFKVQPDGMITYYSQAKFFVMDSTFIIRDTIVPANGYAPNVHDIQVLPNGHYLLIANETVTMDLSSYYYFNGTGAPGSANAAVKCQIIQELDENENLVAEWHLKDVLSFDSVDPFFLSNPNIVDWTHSNAVEMDTDGNYLVSSRHLNEITKINSATGAVMWRLGGNYNQFTFINDTVPFYGQHDIRRLSNGNITLYDNGNNTTPHGARALEYRLDETNLTAEVIWAYVFDSTIYSVGMGNNQRIANDNRLVNYGGVNTMTDVLFTVVREDNSKVFELALDDSLYGYRAFSYLELPWSFNRPQVTCYDSAGSHYLDAGAGYSNYLWSDGSSTRIIEITAADTFSVRVPYGQGGFIYSEELIITSLTDPCGLTAAAELVNETALQLFPIPARDVLNIARSETSHHSGVIRISDVAGRVVSDKPVNSSATNIAVDVSSLEDGLYFIFFAGSTTKFIKGK
jgi:hypothetical protein